MNIIVTIKQVPDTDISPSAFKIDAEGKRVVPPPGVQPIMNGYDANALEEGLRLREKLGGKVTAITVGPDSARDTLKRALAIGADAAIHVNDASLVDPDSFITARALAAAITKIAEYDLVLCGRQASDTDASQVHLGLATLLGLPAASPVEKIESIDEGNVVVRRIAEQAYQLIKMPLPALIGVSSEINEPRYPALKGIMAANRAQIPVWTAADIGLEPADRRTELRRLYIEGRDTQVEMITADSPAEAGAMLADRLREARLV